MITPEQRKRLEAEADYFETEIFMNGAEALARIQDEPGFDESDFIGRSPFEDTRLEEERKWRPLVEEMRSYILCSINGDGDKEAGQYLIARAELLLSTKEGAKDGKCK